MFSSSRRRQHSLDLWPGFVDALATLLMVLIFLVMVFVVTQLYLTNVLGGKEKDLSLLQTKVEALIQKLSNEKKFNQELLVMNESLKKKALELEKTFNIQASQLLSQKQDFETSLQSLKKLLEEALQKEQLMKNENLELQKANLQNTEVIQKLSQENAQYESYKTIGNLRSEFFSKLKEVLDNRQDIRIVGDRFVFQSEVLFARGSAKLDKGGIQQLDRLVKALKEISSQIPQELQWVLRIDGHTDHLPIQTSEFKSNWELSAARAIAVVNYMIQKGIDPRHLVAAGFGEHQPLVSKDSADNLARNRRIEFKLDQR